MRELPDKKQCQCLFSEYDWNPFMFSPKPPMVRCSKVPTVIVKEKEPRDDGEMGSMSLCDEHLRILITKFKRPIEIEEIDDTER